MFLSQLFDVIGVDGALFQSGQPFFLSGGSIDGHFFDQRFLIVVEDFRLRRSLLRVNSSRSVRPVTQQKLPNKPAAAKGTKETAAFRPQRHCHSTLTIDAIKAIARSVTARPEMSICMGSADAVILTAAWSDGLIELASPALTSRKYLAGVSDVTSCPGCTL